MIDIDTLKSIATAPPDLSTNFPIDWEPALLFCHVHKASLAKPSFKFKNFPNPLPYPSSSDFGKLLIEPCVDRHHLGLPDDMFRQMHRIYSDIWSLLLYRPMPLIIRMDGHIFMKKIDRTQDGTEFYDTKKAEILIDHVQWLINLVRDDSPDTFRTLLEGSVQSQQGDVWYLSQLVRDDYLGLMPDRHPICGPDLYAALALKHLDYAFSHALNSDLENYIALIGSAKQALAMGHSYPYSAMGSQVVSPERIEEFANAQINLRKAHVAKAGGIKNASRYDPLRKHALDLFAKKEWDSKRQAATYIAIAVRQFAQENNIKTRNDGPSFDTVYGWLRDQDI